MTKDLSPQELRNFFAAHAAAGIMAATGSESLTVYPETVARRAFQIAEAMVAESRKPMGKACAV